MNFLKNTFDYVIGGGLIDFETALKLSRTDGESLDELCGFANEIRKKFCGDLFDMCTIINAKSGRCSEDCKYCAQSACYKSNIEEYPLVDADRMVEEARVNFENGVLRFSIVTAGRRLSKKEVEEVCLAVKRIIKEVGIEVCVSHGLLDFDDFQKLRAAGVKRYHCNLETSEENFKNICSTHSFEQKIETIKAAQKAGLEVCSGGIMGLGETFEDRISMAFTIRELGIKSVPVNMLNPIAGTPYENNKRLTVNEMRRICAVFRFILPDAQIRLAGGRGLLEDKGESCFLSGANAEISGDMLTTSGICTAKDMEIVQRLGFTVAIK